jgi:hypothetical protein
MDGSGRSDTIFKTVVRRPSPSREGSTPSHSRQTLDPAAALKVTSVHLRRLEASKQRVSKVAEAIGV